MGSLCGGDHRIGISRLEGSLRLSQGQLAGLVHPGTELEDLCAAAPKLRLFRSLQIPEVHIDHASLGHRMGVSAVPAASKAIPTYISEVSHQMQQEDADQRTIQTPGQPFLPPVGPGPL